MASMRPGSPGFGMGLQSKKVCDDALSNGPPDLCNAAPPSAECLSCLANHCGSELMSCQGT